MVYLDLELLDFRNVENVKQMIINNFSDYGLPIIKLRQAKGGIFVYHNRGMVFKRKVRKLIEETDSKKVYSVSYKRYGVSFIDITDVDLFKDSLTMAIMEARLREDFTE